MTQTVREIVAEWLREHGYDGLFRGTCACTHDNVMPCGAPCTHCQPGYKTQCHGTDKCEWCSALDGWHMQAERPR